MADWYRANACSGNAMSRSLKLAGKVVGTLLIAACIVACVFTEHDAELRSTAPVVTSNVGRGTKLYFRFVDERDDVVVGHRGLGGNGAKIMAAELPAQFESSLRDALIKKGFELVTNEQGSDASVVYRLRSFKYNVSQGYFTSGENSAAVLAVTAKRKAETYDHVYRYNNEERIIFVPTGGHLDEQMNAGLTSVLGQADSDAALDAFLAPRNGTERGRINEQ